MNLLKISFTLFCLSMFSFVSALEAPNNITLDIVTSDSLNIHWDNAEGAEVYSISYWESSGTLDWYEFESELVAGQEANILIENLKSNTEYFIGIISYDWDNNNSWYSEEVSFSTLSAVEDLKINELVLKDTRTWILEFNVDLDPDSLISSMVVNENDDLEDIEVEKYTINWNKLELFFTKELKMGWRYSITIITLDWINWEKINAWIDWIIDFDVTEDTLAYNEENIDDVDLSVATDTDLDENTDTNLDENIDTDLYETTNNENNTDEKILAWTELESNTESQVTETVAKENEALPTTGPAETFLFLFFSFIAGWLFLSLRRRTNA